eukprot:3924111-Rhodomonas_salina.1
MCALGPAYVKERVRIPRWLLRAGRTARWLLNPEIMMRGSASRLYVSMHTHSTILMRGSYLRCACRGGLQASRGSAPPRTPGSAGKTCHTSSQTAVLPVEPTALALLGSAVVNSELSHRLTLVRSLLGGAQRRGQGR